MAFFEFLSSIGDLLNTTIGKFIKPIGGRGTGGFSPSPSTGLPIVANQRADVVNLDAVGNLIIRGPTYSDEGGIAEDFNGSVLTTALTGTPTFTNGSVVVTGAGTLFTTELDNSYYIKRDSDPDTAWMRVARILSDTSLELQGVYSGTTGGSASSKTLWIPVIGSGGSISVASSAVTLASGTTNGSITNFSRAIDFMPLKIRAIVSVSQRIANQSLFLGFRDNVANFSVTAGVFFDGTVGTTVKLRSQTSLAAADTQEVVVTLPFGLTTASMLTYDIDLTPAFIGLTIEGIQVAKINRHLVGPYVTVNLVSEVKNTGVAGSTTSFVTDSIQVANYDLIQITNISASESVPVQIREEVHYITGQLTTTTTTADQVIVSFTIPANKNAHIIGYSISVDGNTDGAPVKIGRNTVTTPPAAPGVLDDNIYRMFRLDRSGSGGGAYNESLGSIPRPFAHAGDVIKMTVTPGGTGSTIWRGTIDIILRPT